MPTKFMIPLLLPAAILAAQDRPVDLGSLLDKDLQVTTLDGSTKPLKDFLKPGHPTVIEFWATWCAPCSKTIPSLIELDHRFRAKGLQVLGLSIEPPAHSTQTVKKFIDSKGISYPVAFASPELFQVVTGIKQVSVPKILVYDAQGRVVEFITSYWPLLTNGKVDRAVEKAISTP